MNTKRLFYTLAASVMLAVLMTACSSNDDNPVPDSPEAPAESYETILGFFKQINAVPRPTHHEEKMVDFLTDFAKKRNLRYVLDGKNVIIYKDATTGMEQAPGVILQAHTDMVCVAAEGYDIDFLTQGIESVNDGTYIHSKDRLTSLGADDGIGVAMILAVLNSDRIQHGPLECLFTWDEEDEFSGATSLPADILKGQYMFNIDWEQEGELCIGTAGGVEVDVTLSYEPIAVPAGYMALKLSISDATGGHSGVAINDGGANAIKLLADFLHSQVDNMRLVSMNGGAFPNVIAVSASASVLVPDAQKEAFTDSWNTFMTEAKQQYASTDPMMTYKIEDIDLPARCLTDTDSRVIITGLSKAPQGVAAWSTTIDNMFETSDNIGVVGVGDGYFYTEYLVRGFNNQGIDNLASDIEKAYLDANASFVCERIAPYSSWSPDINSPLMVYAQKIYQQYFGKPIYLCKVGGGLELSEFTVKYPDMQFISYGPTIYDAHTVNERVEIKSIRDCWNYTIYLLKLIKTI